MNTSTFKPVPLARRMLMHRKPRFVLAIAGVGFAVLVMFMQIGFITGFTESQTNLIPLLNADLVMVNSKRDTLSRVGPTFERNWLIQARQVEGVAEVIPLYEDYVPIKNPDTERIRFIHTLAFPAESHAVALPGLDSARTSEILKRPNTFIWDAQARDLFGDIVKDAEIEINGRYIRVADFVHIGSSISRDGFVILGDGAWFALGGKPHNVSKGLIRLKKDADVEKTLATINQRLGSEVSTFTVQQLKDREDHYSITGTPVGVIFGSGLIIGFIIGIVICYQILFSEVLDHLPQYATIRALGFSDAYVLKVVLKESVLLAFIGFIPGYLATLLLYEFLANVSGFVMVATIERIFLVLLLTLPMCCIAGLLALRRALQADPAEVF